MNDLVTPGRRPPDRGSSDPERYSTKSPANRTRPVGSSHQGLIITLLVSLGLHLVAMTAVLLLLRSGIPVMDGPEKPIQVELVMEEHKGDARPVVPPKAQAETRAETRQTAKASPPRPQAPAEPQSDVPRAAVEPVEEARPEPPEPPTQVQQTRSAPQPASQPVPVPPAEVTISLRGTDSPSDARAWGDRIIPAAPDAVFHNRPPEYPKEAVMNGERGTVVVMIHVSPAGTTSGVDVLSSSGYALLDRSVREAVLRWRFLPAVKDGQPVASDMQMGFVFESE